MHPHAAAAYVFWRTRAIALELAAAAGSVLHIGPVQLNIAVCITRPCGVGFVVQWDGACAWISCGAGYPLCFVPGGLDQALRMVAHEPALRISLRLLSTFRPEADDAFRAAWAARMAASYGDFAVLGVDSIAGTDWVLDVVRNRHGRVAVKPRTPTSYAGGVASAVSAAMQGL